MGKVQKSLTVTLWLGVVVGMMIYMVVFRGLLGSGTADTVAVEPDPLSPMFVAPDFELTDSNNETFASSKLAGNVWIGFFFFSECPGICPAMMARLEVLEKAVSDSDVRFVGFSVDPANDTPARLAQYIDAYEHDRSRFVLLTGDLAKLQAVGRGFGAPFEKPAEHSPRLFLVDRKGNIRGAYDTRDADAMNQLPADVQKVRAMK